MKYVLQKGYIRTCTNYSRVLLEKNFNVQVITSAKHDDREGLFQNMRGYIDIVKEQKGWPHSVNPEEIERLYNINELRYIVCVKNPFSWFHSVSKTGPSMHRPDPSNPWPIIEKFNKRYKGWMGIIQEMGKSSYIIRHEDLVTRFDETMKYIHTQFGLEANQDGYANEERNVLGQSKGKKRIDNTLFGQQFNDKQMPVQNNGKPVYDVKTIDRIRTEIDWDVMEFYGYGGYNREYHQLYGDI
jgi:hypothetical protein